MTSFKLNHIEAFRNLRHDTSFTDIFLTCGHNVIPAHRVILSSCSGYFKRVLSHTSHASVTNYCVLDGCTESLLATVIQFIYAGVVEIAAESVEPFVLLCRKLEVLGFEDEAFQEYDQAYDALSDDFTKASSDDGRQDGSPGDNDSVKEEAEVQLNGDDETGEETEGQGSDDDDDEDEEVGETVMVQELDPYRDMPILGPESVDSFDDDDKEDSAENDEADDSASIPPGDEAGPSSSFMMNEAGSSDSSIDDPYRTQCARCLKQFTTAYTRMQHEKYNCSTLSPEERRQNKAKNSCPRCGNGFLTPKLLRKHLRQNACGSRGLVRPFTTSEKPHHWGKPPPDEEVQREVAINIIKVGNRDDGFRWKCGFCGKKYCASWVCKNHIEIAHMKEPQVFGCSTCGAKFRWKSSLNKHRRESCPARVRSLGLAVAAGNSAESGQAVYPCSRCSLTFRWKFALDKHQLRCCHGGNEGAKGFACRKCGRRCLSKVGLKQHEKYFCSVAQTFSVRSSISQESSTEQTEKAQTPAPDLLPIAGAKLTVTKTASMPGQQGASMINLKLEKDRGKKPSVMPSPNHLPALVHLALPTPSTSAAPASLPPTPPLLPVSEVLLDLSAAASSSPAPVPGPSPQLQVPEEPQTKPLDADGVVNKERVESFIIKLNTSDERRWQCRECGFVFKSKYTLEQHIETQHLHVKFSCKYCQSTYTRRYNLLNHQVTCRANQATASSD